MPGRLGLRAFVASNSRVEPRARSAAIDLLVLSPAGLKGDQPTPAAYRRRLSALATAAARLLDAG